MTTELTLDSKEEAGEWLRKALLFSETHYGNIVQMAGPFAEQILPIDVDEFSESSVEIITFIVDDERLSTRLTPSALDDNVSIMEDTESNISLIGFDIFGNLHFGKCSVF